MAPPAAGTKSGKNILLLIADDLGKYVGCYGCASVRTPNLDKLANDGVRFDRAFASTASCSGSRSTIYTGLHNHENGQFGLNIFRSHFQTFSHVDTLPALFRKAGFLTGIIGKVHVGPNEVYPWEARLESDSRDVAWVADQAESFFVRAKGEGRPFVLTVGFVDPHRDTRTRGGFGNDASYDARVQALEVKPESVAVPSWLPDLPEVRQELAEYYKAIYRVDQGIGFVLEALERQGLLDDTLVVFTSDNGPPFLNAKTTLYDAGTCLPLVVRRPTARQNGISNPNMVSYIDFLPTFLEWAGLPLNYSLRDAATSEGSGYLTPGSGFATNVARSPPRIGCSFLPILERSEQLPPAQWQHRVFGSHTFHELQNYWPTRVLRTPRYKYHRNIAWQLPFPFATDLYASYSWQGVRNMETPSIGGRKLANYLSRPAEELFDLETDPDELHNLANAPEHRKLVSQLRLELEQWQQQTKDLWLFRDGCSLLHMSAYAKDDLRVPNRFDLDVDRPSTEGLALFHVGDAVTEVQSRSGGGLSNGVH